MVMVSPADSALITEGSEERRRYMNAVIAQYNREYLEQTIRYNKILAQRNRLLKEMKGYGGSDELLEVYDMQLVPLGRSIAQVRMRFVQELSLVFKRYYELISGGLETVEIAYQSQLLQDDFEELLKSNL